MYTPMSTTEKRLYYVVVLDMVPATSTRSPIWNEQKRNKSGPVAGDGGIDVEHRHLGNLLCSF